MTSTTTSTRTPASPPPSTTTRTGCAAPPGSPASPSSACSPCPTCSGTGSTSCRLPRRTRCRAARRFRGLLRPPARRGPTYRTAGPLPRCSTRPHRDELRRDPDAGRRDWWTLAEQYRRFVALLDVPQRLDTRGIARWRAALRQQLRRGLPPVARRAAGRAAPGRAPGQRAVPPSAFAAGIIAARERRLGLPWGPANELAAGAVIAADRGHRGRARRAAPARHQRLPRRARRLPARPPPARCPPDPDVPPAQRPPAADHARGWRWTARCSGLVFEPNTPALRELLAAHAAGFLRGLYRRGAFAGDTEEQAFFVRVDDDLNPPASVDLGRLVVEVGVAPAEPLEFIVLRITRDGDGGVRVEETTTDG